MCAFSFSRCSLQCARVSEVVSLDLADFNWIRFTTKKTQAEDVRNAKEEVRRRGKGLPIIDIIIACVMNQIVPMMLVTIGFLRWNLR